MTNTQIIETEWDLLPYTSEFEHDVIRMPVRNKNPADIEPLLRGSKNITGTRPFYEVEFRKQYIKSVAVGWEFVSIY